MKKTVSVVLAFCLFLSCITMVRGELLQRIECENMSFTGKYAGRISSPFSGTGFYANGDSASAKVTFPYANAYYRITLKGASNNNTTAGISLYIDGTKAAAASFNSTAPAEQSFEITMYEAKISTVSLVLETDNGSNDTFVDYITIEHVGDIPAPPVLPEKGSVYTGEYRNLFSEIGISEQQVQKKLDDVFNQLFYGTDGPDIINNGRRVYYPVGDDMAYILDTGNEDVRSEGMSYGMMIAVQMNKQEEFNRLWKWAKTYMYHSEGERKGMFAWQCTTSGEKKDSNSAPDGEEYMAASLLFAAARWGNGSGIYNYRKEALNILSYMLYTNDRPGYELKTAIDPERKMVVFCPYGSAASYTDPSYHLPAFYEVFARESENSADKQIWHEVANTSREYFKKCTHPTTGLAPDYASFEGEGYGSKDYYSFDAWRVPMNIAMDYAWWKADEWQAAYVNRIQGFFHSEGMGTYYDNYDLNGEPKYNADHSIGAVGCNAVASLAADTSISWEFVKELWDTSVPEGKWRYYNGLLYMLSLLNVSGNYKAYLSDNTPVDPPVETATNQPAATATNQPAGTQNPSGSGDAPDGAWIEKLNHKTSLNNFQGLYTNYSMNSNVSYNQYGPSSTACMQITGGSSSAPAGIKLDVSSLFSDGDWIRAEFRIQVTGSPDTIQAFVTDNAAKTVLPRHGSGAMPTGQWIDYSTNAAKVISENGKTYFCVTNASGYWYIADIVLYKLNPEQEKTAEITCRNVTKSISGSSINLTIEISNSFKEEKTTERIVACYRNGKPVKVYTYNDVLKADDITMITANITDEGYDSIRIFYWDSLTDMKPLFDCIMI